MNVITRTGVTAIQRNITVKWIKRCLREITRKHYELPVDYAAARSGIAITVKLAGHRSSACERGVTIDVTAFSKSQTSLIEYPAFKHDPVIGSVEQMSPELALAGTIAHEVSHFVQYRYGPHTRWLRNRYQKPHGEGFQDIYRILRSRVVNPHLGSD